MKDVSGHIVISLKGEEYQIVKTSRRQGNKVDYCEVVFKESGNVKRCSLKSALDGKIFDTKPKEFGQRFSKNIKEMIEDLNENLTGSLTEEPPINKFLNLLESNKFKTKMIDSENGLLVKSSYYSTWAAMVARCDNRGYKGRHEDRYRNCSVCDEWKTFEVFKKWMKSHRIYEGWQLDKDILSELGSSYKTYSPDTCVFIPKNLNTFLGYLNNISSGRLDSFMYTIKGKKRFFNVKTRAEAIRARIFCRIQWIRIWLQDNQGLLEPYIIDILNDKLKQLEDNTNQGFYDKLPNKGSFIF